MFVKKPGLYIVGTPIGNLSDMSPRAIDTLNGADLILCEDTRVFGKLASHFNIKTPKKSYHNYNESETAMGIINEIISGKSVALVSDAGMPCISDPGYRIVHLCRENKLDVFMVPGPVAAISAVAMSGFPTDRFTFCGFFDAKKIRDDNKIRHTIIYYESPNRVNDTIKLMAGVMPERRIAIIREITKVFEECIIGYPSELMSRSEWRGEIVIVVDAAPDKKMSEEDIKKIVNEVIESGYKSKDAAKIISDMTGLSKSDAYNMVIKNEDRV